MFARTPRLTLRPGWPEDAPALAAAIGHATVASKLACVPWPYTEDDAAAGLATPCGTTEARFLILDHEAAAPRIVGGIALSPGEDAHELGYWLTPTAWGRGYATEAARAVIDIARHALPVRRVGAWHHLDNPASARVLAKLGFREVRRGSRHSLGRGGEVASARWELDLAEDRSLAMAA